MKISLNPRRIDIHLCACIHPQKSGEQEKVVDQPAGDGRSQFE